MSESGMPFLRTMAAVLAVLSAPAAPAHSRTLYDGTWSVVIITKQGNCDQAYRYPVRITNGIVGYGGSNDFIVSGKVSGNGAVTVSVRRGDQRASGSGRLSATAGSGRWTGGSCAGVWEAERR